MYPHHLPKKTLAVLVASMGLLSTPPAAASVIDSLTAQTSAQAGTNPAVTGGPNSSATYATASSNDIALLSQTSATSFGNSVGPYGAGGNGSGVFDSLGKFQRQWDITNDSGVAQSYSFNFFIYYGGLSANDNSASGTGHAEYLVDIFQDGATSLFSSSAKIMSDGTLITSGTTLNGAIHSGTNYNWGGTNFTVDLGILNPGDVTSVRYDLIGHAFGDYGSVSGDCGYGGNDGYGDFPGELPGELCTITGSSYAFLGDPNALNSTPIPGIGIASHAVPEPAMFGLFGIGLAGLLGLRRRYRN